MGKHAAALAEFRPTREPRHALTWSIHTAVIDYDAANTYRTPGKHALIGTGFGKLGRHHAARPVDGVLYDAAGNVTPLQRRPLLLDAVA